MIVGTAGHIDHGKTTLVRALTGVDTDRLPEEKQRGISIELGYAFLTLADAAGRGADADTDGERIGFIDVPGHERLVHTMLAGATGIDFALLLVAADDGPMPQTQEHLAVLSLLGIGQGAVVVTKADRVDAARLAAVCDEARALVAGSTLEGAPVLPVSAQTGEGIGQLRALLFEAARQRGERAAQDASAAGGADGAGGAGFRLAIDRAFTLGGVGTVVTGTAHAGRVRVGDELVLCPGTGDAARVRVRSVHAQNRAADEARAGQRCALALAGIGKDEVQRGQWLVSPPVALSTTRVDVRLSLWHAEARPLRSGTTVHVHLGAAQVQGSVALLEGEALGPGGTALAQLVLHAPVGAWQGERIVLRDASATRTLAGGVVIDPQAPVRYRRTPQRLVELAARAEATPVARLAALLAAAPNGVDLRAFAAAQGRAAVDPPADALVAGADLALGAAHAGAARDKLLAALGAYHEREPDELGPDAGRLRRLALPRLPEPLFRALLASLVAAGQVVQRGAFVHRPEHGVRLSASEERIAQKVAPRLAEAGFEGAWARDLARDAGESEPLVRTTLARLAQRGELHQVVKDLFYPPPTMATLAGIARAVAAAHEGVVTAASFRDATGLGRKRAIQILEHFDRIGLLRRVGDLHKLRGDCTLFAQDAATAAAAG